MIWAANSWKDEGMFTLKKDRKKELKTQYLKEARRASAIFPAGNLEPHEKPDFLLHADRGKIGIEVTDICLPR